MKTPTQMMVGHLRWTESGTVWADWIIKGLPYGLHNAKVKRLARDLHAAMFRSLVGESLLLGVCADLDPAVVVERMLASVADETTPDWARECQATLDSLDEIRPGERLYWLSVPLAPKGWFKGTARARYNELRDRMGLRRTPPDADEIAYYQAKAQRVREQLPAAFMAEPATPAQMVWLHHHLLHRGLGADLDVPAEGESVNMAGAGLSEPWLDEGGQTDFENQAAARAQAFRNRFVKVMNADDPNAPASYQALSVIGNVPSSGFIFPGGELLGRIDECGLYVDWAMRLTVVTSAKVEVQNTRALRNLQEQYVQRENEMSHSVNVLDTAAAALQEYASILQNDKLEVECQATIIFSLAGDSAESVRQQQQAFSQYINSSGYKLAQRVGYQRKLWWAFHPGVPSTSTVREFAQVTTSRSLAATVPYASHQIGDVNGLLLGLNLANGPLIAEGVPCGPTSVIMYNPAGPRNRQSSGAIAIAGELGSGKSVLLKKLTEAIVSGWNGVTVVVDRTNMGEYALWAEELTDAVTVDIGAPKVSLDPLRLFGQETGARITQSFLTPLLNVPPTSTEGVLLSEVLDTRYLAEHGISALGELVDHLGTDCELAGAKDVARKIQVFSRKDLGRVVFDHNLPTLPKDAAAIVIRTHTIKLPGRSELENEHLFQQLSLEKIFGRAFYALVAEFARAITFSDPDRLAAFVADEAHGMTISPEGEQALEEMVRDGRKHQAVLLMGSHDPIADFGSQTLRGLIPTRILMRHTDRDLAERGLNWLGLEPSDELIDLVTKETSPKLARGGVPGHRAGEMLMRDAYGNIGRGKVLLPFTPERARALLTSDEEPKAVTA